MIKEFRVKNNAGIKEEIRLEFTKGKYEYSKEYEMKTENLVNPIVLFGKNSCGKTSILKSFLNLRNILTSDGTSENKISIPNYLNENKQTEYNIILTTQNIEFEYRVIVEGFTIIKEELKFDDNPIQANQSDRSFVRFYGSSINLNATNNVDLSAAEKDRDRKIVIFYNYILNIDFIDSQNKIRTKTDEEMNKIIVEKQKEILKVTEKYQELPNVLYKVEPATNELLAKIKDIDTMEYVKRSAIVSSGTSSFHHLIALLESKEPGSVLVIDELDIMIHPTLMSSFIKDLNQLYNIQIICSSHNTNLLSNLRPDQIYFTYNHHHNVTTKRVSVSNPKIRELQNIERMYYGGKFD